MGPLVRNDSGLCNAYAATLDENAVSCGGKIDPCGGMMTAPGLYPYSHDVRADQ